MAQKPLEMNGTITDWKTLAPGLAIFTVKKDVPFETFIPGQYTVLGLNYDETSVSRAYSIGSAPEKLADGLEFYVRRVPVPTGEVALTHLLFERKAGDRIWVGPKSRGHFTAEHALHEGDPRAVIFVGAGTGLAPFVSMVESHALRHGSANPKHYMMHGVSYEHDLGYREEMSARMGNKYFATLSRPTDTWTGPKGRVESHFEQAKIGALESAMGLAPGFIRPENAVIMVCGLQGTIANCLMDLCYRGYVPEERKLRAALHIPKDTPASFFFEQYDSEPILDVKNEELMASLRARLLAAGVTLEEPAPVTG